MATAADGKQPVDGFEFKFTRDNDSIAWYTEVYGGDDYTVVNIRTGTFAPSSSPTTIRPPGRRCSAFNGRPLGDEC